jgi:peptidoglycan/LPS O-acetylase OafA/YrhL
LVFVDYGALQSPGLLAKGFYFLTGFGHEAVMVFFVISGFLVGGKVWSLYREGRFGWRLYLAHRLSRLYAVLIVALLLGVVLDWSGYLFFNGYGLYDQGYEGAIAVLGSAPIERMGWRDFLVNAFFLFFFVGPPYGSNGPLWSLAYEWWYYILFPLVVGVFLGLAGRFTLGKAERGKAENLQPREASLLQRLLIGLAYLLGLAGLCWFLTWHILILFWVWLLGVGAAGLGKAASGNAEKRKGDFSAVDGGGRMPDSSGIEKAGFHGTRKPKHKWGRGVFLVLACLLCGGSLLLARVEVLKWGAMDQFLIGIGFSLLLVVLAPMSGRLPLHGVAHYFADFSYSVYLIHFPVLMFVISVGFEALGVGIRMPFGLLGLGCYVGVFAVAIFASWLVSLVTERKTGELRKWLYSGMGAIGGWLGRMCLREKSIGGVE